MPTNANQDGDPNAGLFIEPGAAPVGLALVVVVAIYSTADLARMLADALRESGLLELTSDMFNVGMLLVGAMILVQGLRERSRGVDVGFALGVVAIAIIGFARRISAAERSHLIEYTVLALIEKEALLERRDQVRRVPVPAVLAIVGTTLAGAGQRTRSL